MFFGIDVIEGNGDGLRGQLKLNPYEWEGQWNSRYIVQEHRANHKQIAYRNTEILNKLVDIRYRREKMSSKNVLIVTFIGTSQRQRLCLLTGIILPSILVCFFPLDWVR